MYKVLPISFLLFFALQGIAQNVGIGTSTPAASAQLDVSSTGKGLLPPRMTQAQRNAIAAPAAGLMVWCTDCSAGGELNLYNGTGWINYKLTSIPPFPNILISGQIWAGKNLDVSTYRNGDPIPQVTDAATWAALTTGAYCYYNNDSATYAATYGKLYNWYAVNDPRGLAPAGWHIPSDAEWLTLFYFAPNGLGAVLKEMGTAHWQSPNNGATNSTGFTAVGGGWREPDGTFKDEGKRAGFWNSTEKDAEKAWAHWLDNFSIGISWTGFNKQYGHSVRCLRD